MMILCDDIKNKKNKNKIISKNILYYNYIHHHILHLQTLKKSIHLPTARWQDNPKI